jgi:hypothetical protein
MATDRATQINTLLVQLAELLAEPPARTAPTRTPPTTPLARVLLTV